MRSGDHEIRRSGDHEIMRSGDNEIRRSGDKDISKSGDHDSGVSASKQQHITALQRSRLSGGEQRTLYGDLRLEVTASSLTPPPPPPLLDDCCILGRVGSTGQRGFCSDPDQDRGLRPRPGPRLTDSLTPSDPGALSSTRPAEVRNLEFPVQIPGRNTSFSFKLGSNQRTALQV